jgi:hypothetical protein
METTRFCVHATSWPVPFLVRALCGRSHESFSYLSAAVPRRGRRRRGLMLRRLTRALSSIKESTLGKAPPSQPRPKPCRSLRHPSKHKLVRNRSPSSTHPTLVIFTRAYRSSANKAAAFNDPCRVPFFSPGPFHPLSISFSLRLLQTSKMIFPKTALLASLALATVSFAAPVPVAEAALEVGPALHFLASPPL